MTTVLTNPEIIQENFSKIKIADDINCCCLNLECHWMELITKCSKFCCSAFQKKIVNLIYFCINILDCPWGDTASWCPGYVSQYPFNCYTSATSRQCCGSCKLRRNGPPGMFQIHNGSTQVRGYERFGSHTGRQEVSRYCTRVESGDSGACR